MKRFKLLPLCSAAGGDGARATPSSPSQEMSHTLSRSRVGLCALLSNFESSLCAWRRENSDELKQRVELTPLRGVGVGWPLEVLFQEGAGQGILSMLSMLI